LHQLEQNQIDGQQLKQENIRLFYKLLYSIEIFSYYD
jgi:hypothetical protein